MIKKHLSIILSAVLILFASCSKDDNDEPALPTSEEPAEVSITILKGPFTFDTPQPRMVIESGSWSVIEYRTNGAEHDEMTHFHFLNPDYNASFVVSGNDKGAIFYEYDTITRKPSSEVYITHESDAYLIVSLCTMNWQTMTYDVISESVVTKGTNNASSRGTFGDNIRNIFIRHLDNLSKDIRDGCQKASWIPGINGLSMLSSVWTDIAIPLEKHMLLNDLPEDTDEIADEIILDSGKHMVVSIIPAPIQSLIDKTIDAIDEYYDSISSHFRPSEEDIYESIGIVTNISNMSYPVIEANERYIPAYKVNLTVTGISETSAVLNGSFDPLGTTYPSISSMGYEVTGTDDYRENIPSDFGHSITINGLTPGTEYRVSAYLYSKGRKYERTIRFFTDISLSIYPSSLLFPLKGGSKGVVLSTPSSILKSWEITSKPKWCKIEKAATSFFVDVEESNKEREGEIIVTANLLSGKTYTASLPVAQKKAAWDGTKWNCTGTVTNFYGESGPINFGISINNVAANDFSLSGDLAGYGSTNIRLDGENLILELNYNSQVQGISGHMKLSIKFVRTNETALAFSMSGKAHASGWGESADDTLSGSGSGTLVTE